MKIMIIAMRLRKIREVRGWNQAAVAKSMHITQQSYSSLEQGNSSPKIDTLNRFCEVMNVALHYLLSQDVPISEDSVEKYGQKEFSELISDCHKLEQRLEMFNGILKANNKFSILNNSLSSRTNVA
jgi:transcriptional regulator with XRE-family HTH domain